MKNNESAEEIVVVALFINLLLLLPARDILQEEKDHFLVKHLREKKIEKTSQREKEKEENGEKISQRKKTFQRERLAVERMYGYTCETLRGDANGPLLMARVGSKWFQIGNDLIKMVINF